MSTTTTATLTNNRITVTFPDGTTDLSTKGKRAERATHVLIARRDNDAPFIYGLRSDRASAETEAIRITTYKAPTCVNPYAEAYVVEVTGGSK